MILSPPPKWATRQPLPVSPRPRAKVRRSRPFIQPKRRSARPWRVDFSRSFRGLKMKAIHHTATALCISLGLSLAVAAGVARADDDTGAGDHPNLVAIGVYQVSFHVHADDIAGPYTPPGLNVRNPSINTLYLAYMRRLSPHFDTELTLGVPPITRSVAKGPAQVGSVPYDGQTIATVRWLAPNLLLKYYLFSPDAMFRPYVGVGVNYTRFYSRQVTAAGAEISGGP